MKSGFCLRNLIIFAVLMIAVTGCTLKRPAEMAGDIAPLAPLAAADQADATPTAPAPDQAAGFAAIDPNVDWNGDGAVNVLDVVTAAYNLPPSAQAAQPTSPATLKIEPGTQQVNVGAEITAEVSVQDVENLAAIDMEIRFDPALLQVVDRDSNRDGIQIVPGNFLAADFVVRNDVDNAAGVIRYTVTQVAPTPPASGGGILAIIYFQGIAPGASTISFRVAMLASSSAQEIPAITRSGDIVVTAPGGEGTATPVTAPTATPIITEPTATPTLLPGASPVVITPTPTLPAAAEVQATLIAPDTPTPTPTFTPIPPPEALIINQPLVYIPPTATTGFCYRVMPEDTIETIAMFFGTTPQAINLVNDLNPPYMIQRYQHIFIPQYLGSGPNIYLLQPGDTLARLAADCNLPATMLARFNGLDIDKLPSGENTVLQTETMGLQALIIPIPPFPPPSRYQYPSGPIPIIPYQEPYPIQKYHPLWPPN